MSKWVIMDGTTGRLCILPVGTLVEERLAHGCTVKKEVECNGLLEAVKILHEFERQVRDGKMAEAEIEREEYDL